VCFSDAAGFRETTVEELYVSLQNDDAIIVDVRTPQEFSVGHVPTAVNIPLDGLSDAVRAGQLDRLKSRTISVICASGGRSAQATVRLTRVFNFPSVVNVVGGTSKWIDAGFPIETAPDSMG
jgi:rhodanese-related sulfurtransferase